ncbi:lipopolysaccharide biosynthesis protein [Ottowia thiooxydans]|uniref:lipopolysaccharide biosynthesis protein n=1 Tax=Ottowia thiooxydans TaxID=219182 RepID=UPI000A0682E4|nr:polysaccharide biosynthesis C-terminal domain-containing protein [Ottowia thiooxydans]
MPTETAVSERMDRPPGWRRHAGLINVAAKLSGAAFAFLLNILLARSMEPTGFAHVSLTLAWLAMATALGSISMPLVVVRFVGESLASDRPDLARGVLIFGFGSALLTSLLLMAAAWVVLQLGWIEPTASSIPLVKIGLALLLPNVLVSVLAGSLQALHHALLAEVLSSMLRTVLMLLGLAALWPAAGTWLSPAVVMDLYLAVSVLLLLIASALTYQLQRRAIPQVAPGYAPRPWAQAAVGVLAVLLVAAANERLDLLLLGWQAPESSVAVYAVAQRFSQTVLMAVNAITTVMAPQFVACLPALRAGNTQQAQEVVARSTRLVVLTCFAALMSFALLGPWLTRLFGAHYAAAYGPLMVLLGGQLLAALCGPAVLLAALSGHSREAILSLCMGMLVNAALNWICVPFGGAWGAATATAIGSVVCAGWANHRMRVRLGLNTVFRLSDLRFQRAALS